MFFLLQFMILYLIFYHKFSLELNKMSHPESPGVWGKDKNLEIVSIKKYIDENKWLSE